MLLAKNRINKVVYFVIGVSVLFEFITANNNKKKQKADVFFNIYYAVAA